MDQRYLPYDQRHQYKKVWTALSQTEGEAKEHVLGTQDEDRFSETAERTVASLQETVRINPSDTVLEIGCGVGRVGRLVAPLCAEWIGCDVSPEMLRLTAARLNGLPNVVLQEVSGFDLVPIEMGRIDVVYCTVVFMHLRATERFRYIQEAFRVLKNGGRLFVDNLLLSTEKGWAMFKWLCELPESERPAHFAEPSTAEELTTYLQRAGFQNIESRTHRDTWVQVFGIK